MINFVIGQRWISETEPELGLGLIIECENKTLKMLFAHSGESRTYSRMNPPLKRVRFDIGDTIKLQDGSSVLVESLSEKDDLIYYKNGDQVLSETLLSGELQFSKPEERFLSGLIDSPKLFNLRIETLIKRKELLCDSLLGLMGGKISLIPHQLYIASRVTEMLAPRVLLADQVGLGKTIEASLIIHRLLIQGQVERVMILLPDSLVHQWFFELYRKFSLGFKMINQETTLEKGENPFKDNQRVIVSMGLLKGAPLARQLLAEASFDLLVVDEAHALKTQNESLNFEFETVKELAARIPRLILLTATPEQFGAHDHFRRLQLLDPNKYQHFDKYQEEKKQYAVIGDYVRDLSEKNPQDMIQEDTRASDYFSKSEIGKLSNEEAILALADRYGTGRSYFRNIRRSMDQDFLFFPKRTLFPSPIEMPKKTPMIKYQEDEETTKVFDHKCLWFLELIQNKLLETKILLICKSKKKILKLEQFLKLHLAHVKVATFHSDLSLMARDRQAAYFADPEGAQILLCTEVGSEGRNFEFCQNLVLFDLPLHPHSLEQRIGRLDRIGQKRDISIYVPYVQQSWEEILLCWYHEGLNLFEKFTECSQEVYERLNSKLKSLLDNPNPEVMKTLIDETQKLVLTMEEELQNGRDLLVERNSFDLKKGKDLVAGITRNDVSDELSEYLDRVFDCFGVEVEDIQASTWYVRPGDNMFLPAFPHLDSDGKTFTFSRTKALEREDFDFLTWDHPLVHGTMDLIISQNFGTNTVVMRQQSKVSQQFYFESYYSLECSAPRYLGLERFGAGELMRLLIDDKGVDLSEKWTKEIVDEKVVPASDDIMEAMKKFPKDRFQAIKKISDKTIMNIFEKKKQDSLQQASSYFGFERNRLEALSSYQPELVKRELDLLNEREVQTLEHINKAQVRFEGFRFIL
jgi:ATP-dependent helicase HepA